MEQETFQLYLSTRGEEKEILMFRIIFALAFCLFISVLANFHMHKKIGEIEKQLSSCEDTLQATSQAYDTLQQKLNEMKVDYEKKMVVYIKKVQKPSRYEKLKYVYIEREKDDCQNVFNMLEQYRSVELQLEDSSDKNSGSSGEVSSSGD